MRPIAEVMPNTIVDALTPLTTIFFPILASYKAMRTGNASELSGRLKYWVAFSLLMAIENHLYFILCWLPVYGWFRFGVSIYLTLLDGSFSICETYIHPFFVKHERQIDNILDEASTLAREIGLELARQAYKWGQH